MSRIFKCGAKALFESIQDGALFKYTGADMAKTQMNFNEGGKFHLFWKDYGVCDGVFKELKLNEKIVFSWECKNNDNKAENIGSLVTIVIKEKSGKSILTLVHENIEKYLFEDMNFGWDDALNDLRKSLNEGVARIEGNQSGLDLYFRMKKEIRMGRNKVFQYVVDEKHLERYFLQKASGPLKEGAQVTWTFVGHEPFTVNVQQVIENEMIKFHWGKADVGMSFRDKANGNTELLIEASGWDATQSGLEDSYCECDGWMEFLISLKNYSEK